LITRTAKPQDLEAVKELLQQNGLIYETDIERTVVVEEDERIIATASISAKLIKCVAVNEQERGRDLTALLLTAIISEQSEKGQNQFFLFTKPELANHFIPFGFYKIAAGNRAILMEYSRTGFQDYLDILHRLAVKAERVGCIVMHANPFTKGHRFLIEYGAARCDLLHIFVLSDEKAFFGREERLDLVAKGVSDLPNVKVHPAGDYLISPGTFPAYFLKRPGVVAEECAQIDIDLFGRIAKALYITDRFVGEEPEDELTAMYNHQLRELLPRQGIGFHQVPRLKVGALPVSASRVRKAIVGENGEELKAMLPDSSYEYVISKILREKAGNKRGEDDED
jgi:[citrate (pro-3S)-lyase] ligase